jgi:hypothetical protein
MIFLFCTTLRPALGPIQWVPEVLSPWVKRPGSETDPLVVTLRVVELYPYSSTSLHGVVFN